MANAYPLRIFLDVLIERCRSAGAELDNILALDFPSTAPSNLAQCLREATTRLLHRLEELRHLYESNGSALKDEINAEASTIRDFIDSTASVLSPLLRRSATILVPSELVLPMERLARLVFPDCQIIVEAVPELNYYFRDLAPVIWRIFSSVDSESILEDNGFPKELFHLQLCANPPCGILTHCLLGHEIGHAIYQKSKKDEKLLPSLAIDETAVRRLIDTRLAELQQEVTSSSQTNTYQIPLEQSRGFIEYLTKTQIAVIASRWIREIFCDVIGIGLFGPAFASAAAVFLLPFQDIDSPTNAYPPSRLRMQLSIKSLERSDPGYGYRKMPSDQSAEIFKPLINPWKEFIGTKGIVPRDGTFAIAYNSVNNLGDSIIKEAKDSLGKNPLRQSQYRKEVPHLRSRIRAGLPPNEYQIQRGAEFKTANLRMILNAGWLCYINDMPYLKALLTQFTDSQIKDRFFGLISKGIEAADIQARWKEGKERQQ